MKKLIVLSLILFVAYSCKKERIDYVLMSGKIENSNTDLIKISRGEFSKEIPVTSGNVLDTIHIDENGFYDLNIGRDYTSIFLQKGAPLNFSVDANQLDETINYQGTNSTANNYLAKKVLIKEKLFGGRNDIYKLDENEFIKTIEEYNDSLNGLLSLNTYPNNFTTLEKKNLGFEKAFLYGNYENYHKYLTKNNDFKVSDNFNKNLDNLMSSIDFNNEVDYRNSNDYRSLLNPTNNKEMSKKMRGGEDFKQVFLDYYIPSITNDYIRNSILNGYSSFILSPTDDLDSTYNKYMELSTDEKHKKIYTELYDTNKKLTKGNPSPTFNFENYKGGTTALNDLKGKYVYIDVWATWCGPCKAEIPFLQKIEQEYHGKNIEFVSISIDAKKDYEKWRNFVEEKDLGGIQLIAENEWKSEFVKSYKIRGIPRFILIDPEGNIVSSDALRPSSGLRLTQLLDGLLN